PQDVAQRYVRDHRAQLGLTASDLSALDAPEVNRSGDFTQVQWHQDVDGIPVVDGGVRANLADDGRILNVFGDPAPEPTTATKPAPDAGEAGRALQEYVGVSRSLPRAKGPAGANRATDYADGSNAELAFKNGRLQWRVMYRASSTAVYDAFVDAA